MYKFKYLLVILFFIGCTSDKNNSTKTIIIENAVSLDFSFGDDEENLSVDFLLSKPDDLEVDFQGNMYVLDERTIKAFDQHGKEFKLIGRPGQGPGELGFVFNINMSPTGILSVGQMRNQFHYFDKNHEYLDGLKYNNDFVNENGITLDHDRPIGAGFFNESIRLDKLTFVGYVEHETIYNKIYYEATQYLYYKNNNSTKMIKKYKFLESIVSFGFGGHLPNAGKTILRVTNANKIVFSHSGVDVLNNDEKGYYKLFVYDIQDNTTDSLLHVYEKSLEAEYDFAKNTGWPDKEEYKEYNAKTNSHLKDHPYKTALEDIFVDGNLIYAVLNKIDEDKKTQVDIFDLVELKYKHSIFIPTIDGWFKYPKNIKNGKIYYLLRDDKEFSKVIVYNIDAKVYQKN